MKSIAGTIYTLLICIPLIARQKPLINDTTYKNWTAVDNGGISNNGKFAFYILKNQSSGINTVVIASTDKKWEKRLISCRDQIFSPDSRYLFAMQGRDTLIQLTLKSDKILRIPGCENFQLYKDWLIYQQQGLVILNLNTRKEQRFPGVLQCIQNNVIISKEGDTVKRIDLKTGISKTIFKGAAWEFILNAEQLAFTTIENDIKSIWYYHTGMDSAQFMVKGIATDHTWQFSADGQHLYFTQPRVDTTHPAAGEPVIWNYQDAFLRSLYNHEMYGKPMIHNGEGLTILDIADRKVRQLLTGTQKVKINSGTLDDILVVESTFGKEDEIPWNKYARFSYYLCFTKTGELKPIPTTAPIEVMELSPDKKYLLYYDSTYYSYNIQTGEKQTIDIPAACTYSMVDRKAGKNPAGIARWISGTDQAIIQGTYDLWLLDLTNKTAPIRLTNGASSNIIFSFATWHDNRIISAGEDLLLSGFNLSNKTYGLYHLNIGKRQCKQLYLSKTALSRPYNMIGGTILSISRNGYLLQSGNASASPNFSYTKDFKTFIPISDNYPEQAYNWMTAELVKYKDGEGILYKPSNFDPGKKYPVIFNYYLDQSNQVNEYISPDPPLTGINIPLLVSSGYLFFKPDIYRIKGHPGEAALRNVNAAADYLSQFSWVDTTKMAVSGHSLGGFETNFIITHSNRFAAAIVGAGPSSLIDAYNEIWDYGHSKQSYVGKGMFMMEEGLDKAPDLYIENSPILFSGQLNTPLLMIHNNKDDAVPVEQSLKLFVQLRSLQKPVWLLQYANETHVLIDEKNRINCQQKIKGFLDYYLKGSSMPLWMSTHISPDN